MHISMDTSYEGVLIGKILVVLVIIYMLISPLIRLLRIIDFVEKPSLGYVYEAMQRVKNAINDMFKNKKTTYRPYTKIINVR